mmetsp:Transcript_35448/g.105600  ORF Transcript_35448/g.105600 Transcript_35448/m.105600 type:complete len:701 (+) Transcript_35448:242-2344(+)
MQLDALHCARRGAKQRAEEELSLGLQPGALAAGRAPVVEGPEASAQRALRRHSLHAFVDVRSAGADGRAEHLGDLSREEGRDALDGRGNDALDRRPHLVERVVEVGRVDTWLFEQLIHCCAHFVHEEAALQLVHEALHEQLRAVVERLRHLLRGELVLHLRVGRAEERALRLEAQLVLEELRERHRQPLGAAVLEVLARKLGSERTRPGEAAVVEVAHDRLGGAAAEEVLLVVLLLLEALRRVHSIVVDLGAAVLDDEALGHREHRRRPSLGQLDLAERRRRHDRAVVLVLKVLASDERDEVVRPAHLVRLGEDADRALEEPLTLNVLERSVGVGPLAGGHDDEVEGGVACRAVGLDLRADHRLDRLTLVLGGHVDGDDAGEVDQVDDGHLGVQHVEDDDPVGDDAARRAGEAALELVHLVLHEGKARGGCDDARRLLGRRVVPVPAVVLRADDRHGDDGRLAARRVGAAEAHVDRKAGAECLLAREERHPNQLLEHRRLARALVADDDHLWRRQVVRLQLAAQRVEHLEHLDQVGGDVRHRVRVLRRRRHHRHGRRERQRARLRQQCLQEVRVPLHRLRRRQVVLAIEVKVADELVEGRLALVVGHELLAHGTERLKPAAVFISRRLTHHRRGVPRLQPLLNGEPLISAAVFGDDWVEHDDVRERAAKVDRLRAALQQLVHPLPAGGHVAGSGGHHRQG